MSSLGVEEKDSSTSVRSTIRDVSGPPSPTAIKPFSRQFLDGDEVMTKARSIYIKILAQRTCFIIAAMFGVFSVYWGAVSQIPARRLEGWIVDFDGDRIGQAVLRDVAGLSSPALYWKVLPGSDFPDGVIDLANAVVEERCWVAISINKGSSLGLDTAIASRGNLSYDASSAITAFGVEARNENAFHVLIRPTVETWLQQTTHRFSVQFFTELAANPSINLSSIAPETLLRPVYYTFDNLRPFDVPVAAALTSGSGLIYLLIMAFVAINTGIMARSVSGLDRQLTLRSLLRVRVMTTISIYLILALAYSFITLAFNLPFNRKFGHSGFIIFWMISWFGIMAAGLALETMLLLLTANYITIFLVFWIICNVTVCPWPIGILPRVYTYGYAAPFYQISRAVRTLVFETKDDLGINFGVLIVWIAVSCITLPIIQWYRRRQEVQAWEKKEEETKAGN